MSDDQRQGQSQVGERKRGPGRPRKAPFADPEVVEDSPLMETGTAKHPESSVQMGPVLCRMENMNQFSMYRDEGNVHIRAVREDGTIVDEIISMSSEKSVSVSIT